MLSCTARPITNAIIPRPKSYIYDYATCDSILASASAEVMLYNDAHKRWDPPNGNDGLSVVQIIRSGTTATFRIIGISRENKTCVLNCNIHHKLKYHTATPTFHQWRDEKRQVYGLNFSSPEEARNFVVIMSDSISYLNDIQMNGHSQNEYHQIHHDNVYQDPHQHMPHNQSAPTFREQEEQNGLHPSFRKSSHSVQGSQQLTQQQRRSSQSSSSSSNAGLSGMMGQMPVGAPRAPATIIPPAPALPPTGGAPPAPPPPPANLTSAHAPPPPPPPPANITAPVPKTMNAGLADEIKNGIKLRKTGGATNGSGPSTPATVAAPPPAPPKMDMVQELALTFSKRKAKQAEANTTDNKSNTSNGSSDSGVYPPAKPKSQVNGTASSPKSHRKAPSASSISSQEENITKTVNGAINGLSHGPVTAEVLEKFRAELMVEVRLEINKAKQEIIEAIRAEMRR